MTWRDDLEGLVAAVPESELPNLVGEFARVQAVLILRLSAPANGVRPPAPDIQPKSHLIDATAAAKLLGTKVRWLYDRADDLPFTRRLGPRTLRFDEAGIRRWLETRR